MKHRPTQNTNIDPLVAWIAADTARWARWRRWRNPVFALAACFTAILVGLEISVRDVIRVIGDPRAVFGLIGLGVTTLAFASFGRGADRPSPAGPRLRFLLGVFRRSPSWLLAPLVVGTLFLGKWLSAESSLPLHVYLDQWQLRVSGCFRESLLLGAAAFSISSMALLLVGPMPTRRMRWGLPGAACFLAMFLMEVACGWTGAWHFFLSHVLPGSVLLLFGGLLFEIVVALRMRRIGSRFARDKWSRS